MKLLHFNSFFGVDPSAIYSLFQDLCEKFPDVVLKDVFMTLKWLKLYETHPVTVRQWGYCKVHITPKMIRIHQTYSRPVQKDRPL